MKTETDCVMLFNKIYTRFVYTVDVCIYSGCLYIQWMFVYTVDVCIYSGCLFLYTHTVNKKGHQTVSQAVSQSIYKAA